MAEPPRPTLLQTVLDTADVRALANFYRDLFGFTYRPGDEEVPVEEPPDWLVLPGPDGERRLAFQQVEEDARTTWPEAGVPLRVHLDCSVPDRATLAAVHARVLELGGSERFDRTDEESEPLYVFADPAGYLFCVFIARG